MLHLSSVLMSVIVEMHSLNLVSSPIQFNDITAVTAESMYASFIIGNDVD